MAPRAPSLAPPPHASPARVVWEVLLPGALPNIMTGLRNGLGYGWRALIAAEIIVGTSGIGRLHNLQHLYRRAFGLRGPTGKAVRGVLRHIQGFGQVVVEHHIIYAIVGHGAGHLIKFLRNMGFKANLYAAIGQQAGAHIA
jgi:hypothetical protein